MVYVIGYNDKYPNNSIVIETTSRSNNWSRGLSPFFLNGGHLYSNYYAKNVENAWQFSKVYPNHLDSNGNIKEEYFQWAQKGWDNNYAIRYPMGKGKRPLFSYWNGSRYNYIEARKKIYAPIYAKSVKTSNAYTKLVSIYKESKKLGQDIYLLDFDGYNHIQEGISFKEVVNDPNRKMGHAFVLWYLLNKI